MKAVEDYIRSLGIGAYVVGGAVRDSLLGVDSKDADFLVPGLDIDGLRAALQPHGRTEDLIVAGRTVGLRLRPRERAVRELAPAGIELAPARREVSTGPGRHDFEIVVDPTATVEEDLQRRDFTVNAIARRLDDDVLVDPFHGREDLERGILRTLTERSFAEDPLRVVRGPAVRLAARVHVRRADARADASGGGQRQARVGRADRRRARRRRDGRALEAASGRSACDGTADRTRHGRAGRGAARVRARRSVSTRRAATTT